MIKKSEKICKRCGSICVVEPKARRFDTLEKPKLINTGLIHLGVEYNRHNSDLPEEKPLFICLNCKPNWLKNSDNNKYKIKTGINKEGLSFVENLEIFPEEISKISWYDVIKHNSILKNGWKVPTKNELNLLYESRIYNNIFNSVYYWSITEATENKAWAKSFNNGFECHQSKERKFSMLIIREMEL